MKNLTFQDKISNMIHQAEIDRDNFAKVLASFSDSNSHDFLMAVSDHARLVGRVSALYEVLGVY